MGCLKRYSTSVDGTIPVQALLYEDEQLLASQEAVGIYDGTQKSPSHQSGTVYTTTHRLFYIDNPHPRSRSFAIDLSHVLRTDHYAGLFTSSPKITLYLRPSSTQPPSSQGTKDNGVETWECEVCGCKNTSGLSSTASQICSLCGVPRSSIKATSPPAIPAKLKASPSHHLSSSLPSSSADLHALSSIPSSNEGSSEAIQGENGEISCPACTFLNHPSMSTCEICGTSLPHPPKRPGNSSAKSAPSSRPVSPSSTDDEDDSEDSRMIRLSFRKGGDKAFYSVMRRSLLGKAWEVKSGGRSSTPANQPTSSGQGGINSLLRTVETTTAYTQNSMEEALQDLESLAIKARDMVKLAEELNERLTAATAATSTGIISTSTPTGSTIIEPEEATFIRSSLSQLGLQMPNAPVTLDMIRDERRWHEELARELAGMLQGNGSVGKPLSWDKSKRDYEQEQGGGMMRNRGIVGLDEVWGGWNRARGVALIPPSTFLQVLPHLPSYTSPPIHMRTFPASGLSVLHTPPYTRVAFAARMVGLLTLAGPKTTVEVAQDEQLPMGLTQEMINEVEDTGEICRDEGGGGIGIFAERGEVKWWINVFRDYEWDGQAFDKYQ
ncbi:hypothetical protein K474DRAFT_1646878 [Panus rudis PR-1116 ss-1]|nr:hypothetical protein K474DRAFT_1646878 [Panus rudis PR-1116 ss-1]